MKFCEKFKKLDKATVIRSILLILAIANQIVAIIGQTSFAQEKWYQIASIVVTAITAIVAAWENNDWTYFARLGTGVLNALQDGKLEAKEVEELLAAAETKKEAEKVLNLSDEEIESLIDNNQLEIECTEQKEQDHQ